MRRYHSQAQAALPEMQGAKEEMKFRPQVKNANKHNTFGLRLLEESLQRDGFIDAQTAAADGEIISGSARLEVAAEKFDEVEPIIVHSDGSRPVIVVRDDIPNANHARARRLSVAANQIAKADFNPDGELLKEWAGEDDQIRKMFADDDWMKITGEGQEDNYSRKIEAPIYIPKGNKPATTELFDDSRTKELIAEIDAADISEDEKQFLKIAANRHTVLRFDRIADYYAHSNKKIQVLMENNCLVIIDFKKAIELGYVELTNDIAKLVQEEYGDD